MKIAILGAGAYGTALGEVARANQHEVTFYDPQKLPEVSMAAAVAGAEAVALCVPSGAAEAVLRDLTGVTGARELPLICATKGLMRPVIFADLGFMRPVILSGAGFAAEFLTAEVFLTATDRLAGELWRRANIHFDFTDDLTGVMLCGTLKNVLAIAAGRRGLATAAPEIQEAAMVQYLAELKTVIAANGGAAATAELNCGRRDLELTCLSEQSRNYQLGQKIAELTEVNKANVAALVTQTVEGWEALQRMAATPELVIHRSATTLQELLKLAA